MEKVINAANDTNTDTDEGSIQACIDEGMEMHVAKPIDRHELAEAMIELLKKYNKLSIGSS